MKPLVLTSTEDETGDRCVDVIRMPDGQFAYRECRRDPEDGHGWRYLSEVEPETFESEAAAMDAAWADVGWMIESSEN